MAERQIAKQETNLPVVLAPSLSTRAMDDLVAFYTNRSDEHPGTFGRRLISAASAPQGQHLSILAARRQELRASLRPTPGDDLDDVLCALMATGETFGASAEETDVKVRLYAEALFDMPTWAVEKARRAFSRPGWKSPWNGRGIPSSADVVAECRAILVPIEAELYRIGQILDAEVVDVETTQEERDLALEAWAQIRSGIAKNNVILRERTEDEINRERDAQHRAKTVVREREERGRQRMQAALETQLRAGREPFTAIEREEPATEH